VHTSHGREVGVVGGSGQQRLRTGGVLVELLGLALLAHVNAGKNTLGVEVVLLDGSDDAGVNTLDNLVNKKISRLVVDRVLGQIRDGSTNLAVFGGDTLVVEARLGNNGLDSVVKDVLVVDKRVDVVTEVTLLGQNLVDGLLSTDVKTLVASLNSDEAFNLASNQVHLVLEVGLKVGGRTSHHVLGGLDRVRAVLVLLARLGQLGSVAAEAGMLVVNLGGSHGHRLATSLEAAVTIDTKSGAVVVDVEVRAIAELDAQAFSLQEALTERAATRRGAARVSSRHVTKRARNSAGMLVLEAAVAVVLVGRGVNVSGTFGGRNTLLLGAGHGEVMGNDGSLDTVTVEDMVFRTVHVIVVLHSTNVLDRVGLGTRKSTGGLLVIVDRGVGRYDRGSVSVLTGNTVAVGLIRLLVMMVEKGRQVERN
jgi:hypothetical protein